MSLGPTPPYSNPPIQPQNFQPSRFVITDVTLGHMTTVTTGDNMNYVIGQLVRLLIPFGYGCIQLNSAEGYVIEIPSATEVVIDIDSSINVNEFVSYPGRTPPEILAIGDINSGIISSTGRFIPSTNVPGAFINIS